MPHLAFCASKRRTRLTFGLDTGFPPPLAQPLPATLRRYESRLSGGSVHYPDFQSRLLLPLHLRSITPPAKRKRMIGEKNNNDSACSIAIRFAVSLMR